MINSKLQNLLKKKQIEQLSDEWFKTRYNMLTASECSSSLEANPYLKKYELLKKKCNPLKLSNDTEATYWGKKI